MAARFPAIRGGGSFGIHPALAAVLPQAPQFAIARFVCRATAFPDRVRSLLDASILRSCNNDRHSIEMSPQSSPADQRRPDLDTQIDEARHAAGFYN
jgi:hypothetical protein